MNSTVKTVLSFTAGLAVGGAAGYLITKKQLETQYAEIADAEIASVKRAYEAEADRTVILESSIDSYAGPEDYLQRKYDTKISELGYVPEDTENLSLSDRMAATESIEESTSRNVFEESENDPSEMAESYERYRLQKMEELMDARRNDSEDPYIITMEEYMTEYPEEEKMVLVYYEEDTTLCDESDRIVEALEGTIGLESIENFGIGCESETTVYVRNPRLNSLFEVHKRFGAYSEEVFGGVHPRVIPRTVEG